MNLFNCLCTLAIITCSSYHYKNNDQKIKDFFTIPVVQYNNTGYQLSWSAHPSTNYYKQEYLPGVEKSESYSRMIIIEAVVGDISLKDVVGAKINELAARKKTDALVNYQVIENKATGEYLLDFILSQSSGGTTAVVEWNAYRYAKLKDKSGKMGKGIQLFALSKRGYGAATGAFLKNLKTERSKELSFFAGYGLPVLTIAP